MKNALQFIWKETRKIGGNICSAWSKVDPGMKFVIVILALLLVAFILKDFSPKQSNSLNRIIPPRKQYNRGIY